MGKVKKGQLTIEIENEEDGGDEVGNERDKEVDNTLSEQELPKRRSTRRHHQSRSSEYQDNQVKRHGVQVDELDKDGCDLVDDTGLGDGVPAGFDGGNAVEEDAPLAEGSDNERDGDKEVTVPDGDGAEHQECGS